ncbi:MAG: glycosyltransferase family 4 protein [Thermoanaerobaculia bacterium]
MSARIAICAAQIPFVRGGAEVLYESLRDELRRRGHQAEIVSLPFNWSSRANILQSALAWRLVDLTTSAGEPIDLVIATRFPSYLVQHPRKVVWLIHQFRQIYDLKETAYSDFGDRPEDAETEKILQRFDQRALGEARSRFTISRTTADRLARFNRLDAEVLYPPPGLTGRLRASAYGDYVFSAGRLDPMKRFDLLLRAVAAAKSGVRCVVAGEGPERDRLLQLALELGIADRVELPGRISDERLIELYSGALAVFYAPFDEDYGYVTVEAFQSARPVLTTVDSGGVLEFVEDGVNGFVVARGAHRELGARIDRLAEDRTLARRLGEAGRARVASIQWDGVVERLLAPLG